ncbi:hypothetical protein MNBD_CHLOROFLEXI01-1297 [hydrothermal vent metagenome]|uniref:HTH cro/C1-type domain-containing protein n=1 Tax=hydrothermal vent metagenome TaxID=652676 RepID=A0A3B0VY11_9ZZZZ
MTNSVYRPEYKLLRQILIESRQIAELTQTELAKILSKPQSFVSKYENGERRLDLIEFLDIALALGIEPINVLNRLMGISANKTILDKWEISAGDLTDLLEGNPSLRGMLLGYVAEHKLRRIIATLPEISYTTKFDDHDRKKKGGLYIIYKGRAFDIESKSLQTKTIKQDEESRKWFGKAQVDASDRREVTFSDGSTLNTTLLLRGEFDILAVNCYAFENKWHFVFARKRELPTSSFRKYSPMQRESLLASLVSVSWPPERPFYADIRELLNEMVEQGEGADPSDLGLG